jgi:hypothetical protein
MILFLIGLIVIVVGFGMIVITFAVASVRLPDSINWITAEIGVAILIVGVGVAISSLIYGG